MLMTVNLANGDRYIVWFQRRWVNNTMLNYQTRLQTNLNGANGDVKFKTSGSSAEASADNQNDAGRDLFPAFAQLSGRQTDDGV